MASRAKYPGRKRGRTHHPGVGNEHGHARRTQPVADVGELGALGIEGADE